MRILASEVENRESAGYDSQPLLVEGARKVWKFYQEYVIREIIFRADRSMAVLMLVRSDVEEAKQKLSELPLVLAGLIDFDLIPLVTYPGFSRLFASQCISGPVRLRDNPSQLYNIDATKEEIVGVSPIDHLAANIQLEPHAYIYRQRIVRCQVPN